MATYDVLPDWTREPPVGSDGLVVLELHAAPPSGRSWRLLAASAALIGVFYLLMRRVAAAAAP